MNQSAVTQPFSWVSVAALRSQDIFTFSVWIPFVWSPFILGPVTSQIASLSLRKARFRAPPLSTLAPSSRCHVALAPADHVGPKGIAPKATERGEGDKTLNPTFFARATRPAVWEWAETDHYFLEPALASQPEARLSWWQEAPGAHPWVGTSSVAEAHWWNLITPSKESLKLRVVGKIHRIPRAIVSKNRENETTFVLPSIPIQIDHVHPSTMMSPSWNLYQLQLHTVMNRFNGLTI